MLSLENLPEKLVIIGGGVIGVEFATIFGTFGTQVTIIEKLDRILMNVDDDARNLILKILKRNNIEIITEATVTAVNESEVSYEKDGKTISVSAQKILMSVGMRPNTKAFEHLNLSTERGAIITNERLQTSIPNVYAIGDLNGKMMLAHVASHEGIVAVENIMGKNSTVDYSKMPSGIYGFPEIAMVGLTETQAQEQLDYQVGRFPLVLLVKP